MIQHYRARYYDSGAGRFLAEDPMGIQEEGTDLYRYSANEPTRYVDPFGTCIIELYVVPTGQHNEGHFYHSFITLFDNSGNGKGNPTRIFRGGPGPGVPPMLEASIGPLLAGGNVHFRTPDQPDEALFAAPLLNNNCSCEPYLNRLNSLVGEIERAKIRYTPWHTSNSVTSTAIDFLGLTAPKIPIDVRSRLWGWGGSLVNIEPRNGGGGW